MKLDKIAEQQIKQAQLRGELDNLEGEGKPLPPRSDTGDSIESIGFKIMAGAGAIPEEVKLRKAVEAQLAILQNLADPIEKKSRYGQAGGSTDAAGHSGRSQAQFSQTITVTSTSEDLMDWCRRTHSIVRDSRSFSPPAASFPRRH